MMDVSSLPVNEGGKGGESIMPFLLSACKAKKYNILSFKAIKGVNLAKPRKKYKKI